MCSATQDRQDALSELLARPLDLLLAVGGYNSANTGHLLELARMRGVLAFHVSGAECLLDDGAVRHWSAAAQAEVLACAAWPAQRPLAVGLAAGASTPDARIGALIERMAALAGCAHALPVLH